MYVTLVSFSHAVCAKGMYIAICSGTVETDNPEAEIRTCIDLLGQPLEIFIKISDLHEPLDDGKDSQIFVTSSYDATSHFESASDDVLQMYERITGEKFDLNVEPPEDEEY
jgi:Rab GDP dissociation inhibitor